MFSNRRLDGSIFSMLILYELDIPGKSLNKTRTHNSEMFYSCSVRMRALQQGAENATDECMLLTSVAAIQLI